MSANMCTLKCADSVGTHLSTSPIFLPNGSVVVVGTGFGGPLQVAYADTWKGPYRQVDDLPFASPMGTKFEDPGKPMIFIE